MQTGILGSLDETSYGGLTGDTIFLFNMAERGLRMPRPRYSIQHVRGSAVILRLPRQTSWQIVLLCPFSVVSLFRYDMSLSRILLALRAKYILHRGCTKKCSRRLDHLMSSEVYHAQCRHLAKLPSYAVASFEGDCSFFPFKSRLACIARSSS